MNDKVENFVEGTVWRTSTAKPDRTPYFLLEFGSEGSARLVYLAVSGPDFFARIDTTPWQDREALLAELHAPEWSFFAGKLDQAKALAVDFELRRIGEAYDNEAAYFVEQGKKIAAQGMELVRMHYEKGKPIDIAVKHPAVAVIATHMVRFFQDGGGPNYASLEMKDPATGTRYEVIVKPCHTKMPATLAAERLEELTQARAHILELQTELANLKSGGSKETAT